MAKVTVTLVSGHKYKHEITNGTHVVISDASVADGGNDAGLNPKELAMGALGACTAMTVLGRKAKNKWDIQELTVDVSMVKEDDPNDASKKITKYKIEMKVKGNLTQTELDAIKNVAATKCPVHELFENAQIVESTITKTA